ncbi:MULTISPECIES: hypothetical protein [unclassified Myxococcus]|uniref:hypothetical protein n=1 Tax=unclassified Myxococcus TaxID=2648731 RepID=UPI001C2D3E43|nr:MULTISPECIES: hypothetical protein [unclassified Myxococcus]
MSRPKKVPVSSLSPRRMPAEPPGGPLDGPAVFSPGEPHNLPALVEDARDAALMGEPGPREPSNYQELFSRLSAARDTLPGAYRDTFYQPLLNKLGEMGATRFAQLLQQDPRRTGVAGLLLDATHAVLQNAERYELLATDAFQEVVSDLFDGFLSAESRRGVSPPDQGILPPLVKWGSPDSGPYTWPVDATSSVLGLMAGVVSLPPANAHQGLLAWAALPHEAAGHDILDADSGLSAELSNAVHDKLKDTYPSLATYWADRIDETAADVLGILNMGPTSGIGLLGYFRGLNAAWGGGPVLRRDGPSDDSHPADVLRGYLAAATVDKLLFANRAHWAGFIEREVDADVNGQRIVVEGVSVSRELAKHSAGAVAEVLVTHRAAALEGHALGQIQNWRDTDEARVQRLARGLLHGPPGLPTDLTEGTYAAHLVAAAMVSGLTPGADLSALQSRMLRQLKQMHDANPVWSSLVVAYRGNAVPHRIYRPQRTAV